MCANVICTVDVIIVFARALRSRDFSFVLNVKQPCMLFMYSTNKFMNLVRKSSKKGTISIPIYGNICCTQRDYTKSRTEQKLYERLLDKTMKLLITNVDIRKHPDFGDYLAWIIYRTVLFSIVFTRKFSIPISLWSRSI